MKKNNHYDSAKQLASLFADFIADMNGKRSSHTIEGYRVAMRLFADFAQKVKRLKINDFGIAFFTQDNVYEFSAG